MCGRCVGDVWGLGVDVLLCFGEEGVGFDGALLSECLSGELFVVDVEVVPAVGFGGCALRVDVELSVAGVVESFEGYFCASVLCGGDGDVYDFVLWEGVADGVDDVVAGGAGDGEYDGAGGGVGGANDVEFDVFAFGEAEVSGVSDDVVAFFNGEDALFAEVEFGEGVAGGDAVLTGVGLQAGDGVFEECGEVGCLEECCPLDDLFFGLWVFDGVGVFADCDVAFGVGEAGEVSDAADYLECGYLTCHCFLFLVVVVLLVDSEYCGHGLCFCFEEHAGYDG